MQGARLYRDTRVLNKLTTFYARCVHAPLQSMHSNQLEIIAKIHTKIYDNTSYYSEILVMKSAKFWHM